MSVILTPDAPLTFQVNRLRAGPIADTSRFTDADLLGFLSDGYQSACERSKCLRAYTQILTTSGVQSYALPADWVQTIRIYQGGGQLDAIPLWQSAGIQDGQFYEAGQTLYLGADPGPNGLTLYYARTPQPFLTLQDTPEDGFGVESYYLLRDYAAWRCLLLEGGAESIQRATYYRTRFDAGVVDLSRRFEVDQSMAVRGTSTFAFDDPT